MASKPSEDAAKESLAYAYGGNYRKGWLAYVPETWLPYVQLARLSPPVGLFLIYFPHAFGLVYAAIRQKSPPLEVLQAGAVLFGASFFVSNAIHIWNDLVDAPLDAQVQRTCNRPIPRGAVSWSAALVFTASQVAGALLFLPALGDNAIQAALYSAPGYVAWLYYPYAKRHTYWTQAVLGFCLSWGIVMGTIALRVHPYSLETGAIEIDAQIFLLFLANTFWTMIYDSVYAFQDIEDDIKADIGSMAVLFKFRIKTVFWMLVGLLGASLTVIGVHDQLGVLYYLISVGGTTGCLSLMVANVDLGNSQSCWWWFSKGFWYAGSSILGGLLAEYLSVVLL